jgi:hypothetical protein
MTGGGAGRAAGACRHCAVAAAAQPLAAAAALGAACYRVQGSNATKGHLLDADYCNFVNF